MVSSYLFIQVMEAYRQEVIEFLSQYNRSEGQKDDCPGELSFAVNRINASLLKTKCPFYATELFQVS